VPPIGESRDRLGFDLAPDLRGRLQHRLEGFTLPPLPAAVTGGAPRQPVLRFGTIISGDQFINCEVTRKRLFERFQAQAVEMEGAAVAQVAAQFNAPCIVVRCLSDLAGGESHLDFPAFLPYAAESAAQVLRRIVPAL
jgi:adenosylhomocysteine nucleosidase